MDRKPNVALYLGRRFMRDRALRMVRQTLVVAIFVIFMFTLTAMNVSFDLTFHKADDALQTHGGVILADNGSLVFNLPPNRWVWNSTQAYLDNATLMLMSKAKQAFDAITWSVAIMLVAKEAAANWNEAKQENEESKATYGLLYIVGVKPGTMWPVFFAQKLVVYSVGVVVGSLAAVYLVLPFVLAQFQGTIGALFFKSFDYSVSFVAAMLMVSMGMSIRSYVLMRGTRHKKLRESLQELS